MSTAPTTARRGGRAQMPLGTVRIVPNKSSGRGTRREIKYRMDARGGLKWMSYARWWWLRHRGPIPAGLRVLHADGDTMNDDPSNYLLGTAGDNAAICHRADPDMSRRNHEACSRASAEANQLRARLNRLRGWVRSRWYLVDHVAGVIDNRPCESKREVYALAGVVIADDPNGRCAEAAALGWPGLYTEDAMTLHLLAERHGLLRDVMARLNELRSQRGLRPIRLCNQVSQIMWRLKRRGYIVRERLRRGWVYAISQEGRQARTSVWTPKVAVRGARLSGARYDGYAKLDPELGDLRRRGKAAGIPTLQINTQEEAA